MLGNSERGVATEPPPVIQFSATITQWEIYDTYMADYKHLLEEVGCLRSQNLVIYVLTRSYCTWFGE